MSTFSKKPFLLAIALLLPIILLMFFLLPRKPSGVSAPQQALPEPPTEVHQEIAQSTKEEFSKPETKPQSPISNAQERITKKPFGIFINPKTSPVQPEKFSGFHTGTDFEVFPEELSEKIEVFAVCEGGVTQEKYVNGYGGVIIQNCTFQDNPITVLYGHIDLEKSSAKIGSTIKKNDFVATLADDKSYYSSGERKHLHLGIHKGNNIELRGYVQTKNQLEGWFDFEEIFPDAR